MDEQISHPDLLWKDLFTEFHEDAVLFFFGKKLHDSINFSIAPEFLEQEFNDAFTGNDPTKKAADKVIRYRLKNGKEKIVILHAEFQGKAERDFSERMFWYYIFIAQKYKTTDITALAVYTGAAKPKVYNIFERENFGTEMRYKFNTYIVRNQDETKLLASDNIFAIAVLASLYLIRAGKNGENRYAYKKKLVEISISKQFDRQKLFRMLTFVEHLIKLPKNLEYEFKNYISQPKIQESMLYTKEYLTNSSIFGNAVTEIRNEERQASEARGEARGREQEREHLIINVWQSTGYSVEKTAKILGFHEQYVQAVVDKFEKKA